MSNLVDFIPILQYLPSPLRTCGRRLHRDLVNTYGGLINEVDRRMRRGEDVPECLAKNMLQVRDAEQLDDLDMAITASAFMIGGVETVSTYLLTLLMHNRELADHGECRQRQSCNGSLL